MFMTTPLLPLPHLPCVLLDVVLLPAVPEAAGAGPDCAADETVGEDQQGQGEEEIRQTAKVQPDEESKRII